MTKEISIISPESLEVANLYLQFGTIAEAARVSGLSTDTVVEQLNKRETKRYIDTVYLDLGYRNRTAIGSLLDEMIESKLEQARETQIYSTKDLADLLQMAHKMRMEEIKAQNETMKAENSVVAPRNQTNVQINDTSGGFGQGNYGELMKKLMTGDNK